MSKEEKMSKLVPCMLELIKSFQLEDKPVNLEGIAKKLNISLNETREILIFALKENLLEKQNNGFKLTEKGEEHLRKHRETYIHDRLVHNQTFFGRITKIFERRKIKNWRFHWRKHHGLNGNSINTFYSNIQSLKGRVEETLPLTQLREGQNAQVAYMLGGRGMIRRLAEMGITPGTEIKLLRKGVLRGPVQIFVRGSCLALGYGVASRIFVKPVKAYDDE